jgi:hypothetical protein
MVRASKEVINMIYIEKANDGSSIINLTVGDDASLSIDLKTDDGEEYKMSENEYLIFSVREKPNSASELLVEIQSEGGSNEIKFAHADTADLSPGYYSAEAQLMTEDGKRITVWPMLKGNNKTSGSNRKNFCLMTEVVYE